jgi:hypothetical protein
MSENQEPVLNKNALWNWISLLLISLGGVAGILATNGKLTNGQCGDWGMQCLVTGMMLIVGAGVLGFFAAIAAYIRHEKIPALTWVGLVLNGLVILAAIVIALMITFK